MTNPIPAPVPVALFGKDHWSLLAYIETVCVDGKGSVGALTKSRLRCNEHTHPLLAVNADVTAWKAEYSTRLAGFFEFSDRADAAKAVEAGLQVLGHDDWDCLDDLAAAGYLEILSMVNGFVRMRPLGQVTAALLRDFKAKGGQFAHFSIPVESVVVAEHA